MTSVNDSPKLSHPRILLMDDNSRAGHHLANLGYPVLHGRFGVPYLVEKGDGRTPVIPNDTLPPNYADADIVTIDLAAREILRKVEGEKVVSSGEPDWWAKKSHGIVDPRPRSMQRRKEHLDRIYQHGGCFIVFASADYINDIQLGTASLRSFLTVVELGVQFEYTDGGHEINAAPAVPDWFAPAKPYLNEGEYDCTLEPSPSLGMRWLPLALNKYGQTVAAAIRPAADSKKVTDSGWVFIFPQLAHKGSLIIELVTHVLPELMPELFPHYEGTRWLHDADY
jgi:hypothetical protein